MNYTIQIGRLTKDVELRYTQQGTAVANFTVAVNRDRTANGEPEADFHRCTAWGKTAEAIANNLRKGAMVAVQGKIQNRSYDKDGQRVYITEIKVDYVKFLTPRNQQQGQGQAQTYSQGNYNTHAQNSVQASFGADTSFMNEGHPIDINEDDLPF